MVVYGLGILPLICELQQTHPVVAQAWYADDAGVGGNFEGIRQHLDYLMVRGPLQGYFPELTKSILVVSHRNAPRIEALFRGYGIQIVTLSHYIRSFVGTMEAQDCWLGEKAGGWRDLAATLVRVACWHPQTAYAGLQKFLQQE